MGLGVIFTVSTGCRRPNGEGTTPAQKGARPFPVEVAPVQTRALEYAIDAVGSLEPEEEFVVVARVPGVVDAVTFQEGTAVTPDTELAVIDAGRHALTAARSRAAHARTQAELREAEAALARRKALREKDPGYVSEEELSTHAALVEKTKAALAEAKAALDLAEQDLRDARVRAPHEGTINEKLVRPGQFVDRGTPLARLVDTRRLRLRFRITEAESVRIPPAPEIAFRTRAHAGRDFPAQLFHLGRQADPATRMVDGLAWVDNGDGLLKPGFFAEVRIRLAGRPDAPVVPETAVRPTERGVVAYVVEGNVARERRLNIGLHTADGHMEVLEGLAAGERLVIRGAHALKEGSQVDIVTARPDRR